MHLPTRILALTAAGSIGLVTTGCDTETLQSVAAAAASSQGGNAGGAAYGSPPPPPAYASGGYGGGYSGGYGDPYRPAPGYAPPAADVPYGLRLDARDLDTATDTLRREVDRFLSQRGGKPTGGFQALKEATTSLETASDRFSDLFKDGRSAPPAEARQRLEAVENASLRVEDRIRALSSTPPAVIGANRDVMRLIRRLDSQIR